MEREVELVQRDVIQGKVSAEAALRDYGVVLDGSQAVDLEATERRRAELRSVRGPVPFFDRGPGYVALSGGRTAADVDWVAPRGL